MLVEPALQTTIANAVLASEFLRGPAVHAELADARERAASLSAKILNLRDGSALVQNNPKEPTANKQADRNRSRQTPKRVSDVDAEADRLRADLDSLQARISDLEVATRISGVHRGVAICEDRSEWIDLRVYAPGTGTDATRRGALVFQEDENSPVWTVRLRFSPDRRDPTEGRGPGCFDRPTETECLDLARDWVACGSSPY